MKILLYTLIPIILGVAILNIFGGLFVQEITKDVVLPESSVLSITKPELNKAAPYFELSDLSGALVKLSELKKAPLVLTFWSTWNNDAVDQLKIWDDFKRKNPGSVAIIAINSQEDKSLVANFIRRSGYSIKVLLDPSGATSALYKARSLPATYFIDQAGVVRNIFVGVLSEKELVDKLAILFK